MLRVLIVDLNNFARYPTIAVGYLTAILRSEGDQVTVFSPLAYGVPGVAREPPETAFRNIARRLNYLMTNADCSFVKGAKQFVSGVRSAGISRAGARITQAFDSVQLDQFDVVLISTYLMYYEVCAEIGRRCQRAKVPLIVGGSYFAVESVSRAWLALPGLKALIAGEVELELSKIIRAVVNSADLTKFDGVKLPDGRGTVRKPLSELDQVPFPDYQDFPWKSYPNKIIPIITGRGCSWGVCSFCSDVTSTAGRTFRSRSLENVRNEIHYQAKAHETSLFAFTDLKLNSNIEMWNGILDCMAGFQSEGNWICAVHVGGSRPNGLDRKALIRAKRAGLARITTGLESGSQPVLDLMRKGTNIDENSRFLREAKDANLSVRVTMIHGYPGEEPDDVMRSTEFLVRHSTHIDRVMMNRFQMIDGPTFMRQYMADPSRFPGVEALESYPKLGIANHRYTPVNNRHYIRATQRLLGAVHQINKKPIMRTARHFEGVM